MSALPADPSISACAPAATACTHCGLPVPPGLVDDTTDHQFCCNGCRSVFAIINGGGLGDYYAMRRAVEKKRAAVRAADARYDAFDDPTFVERYTTDQPDGTRTTALILEGLHCMACVWLIERLARVAPGVISATVSFARSRVEVRYDPNRTTLAAVARALHALGYPVGPHRTGAVDVSRRVEARRQLVRIGVAGAIAGNIMIVTIALYAGAFEGIADEHFTLFRWVAAGLGLLSLVWPGRVFFRGAINAVRTRTVQLDVPIAIALAAGCAWGLFNTVRGEGEIYFDCIATLVFLLLVGRFLQAGQQRRSAEAVDLLLSLTPNVVRTEAPDGTTAERPAEAVSIGDTAVVHAGETIPVDGTVITGKSAVDRALLTGESTPIAVEIGDEVHAGSLNISGPLRVRTEAVGDATRAARIMSLVGDAMAGRAPIVDLADRIAGWFVVVVIGLAALTAAVWWSRGPGEAIEHATALLIVTCPCALGLATPLVLSTTIGRLAARGILVKGGAQLEALARPATIVFDKTGTVTTGVRRVTEWTVHEEIARRVRTLEAEAIHPVARAIVDSGHDSGTAATHHEHIVGGGVRGVVDDRDLVVGSPAFLDENGLDIPEAVRTWATQTAARGDTPVLIGEDGYVLGGVAIAEDLRDDAHESIDRLTRHGWTTELLSGDDQRVTSRVADRLGIDAANARGGVSPEDKLARVRTIEGRVVMVGDGVNDAGALAAADIGVAAEGGAEVSFEVADVAIRSGGLASVVDLIDASRHAMTRIRMCIGVSLGYNAVAASLAIAGLLHPLVAAVLMPLSSVTVVAIAGGAGRLRKITPTESPNRKEPS